MKKGILTGLMTIIILSVFSQTDLPKTDTFTAREFLPDITIVGQNSHMDIHQLPEIVGTHIFAGKKNSLVVIDNVNGNIVTNNMRQVLAKVPGIHIWESDGSGIQIGVATRGLSPNRSWDFNVRQNGYDISADPFGYPEAYYNPPLAAVQRLQIVKGAGSLQYGPQIGGMLNYVIHNGSEIDKPFSLESKQTVGSFGLINTFNAIGGKLNNSHYYAFFDHRNGDGYRDNSAYKTNTGYATYTYNFNDKWKANVEMLQFYMLSQQPGGLTDSLFALDRKQSLRSRNWFNLNWTTAASTIEFKPNESNIFNLKIFGLRGDRNSIGFMQPLTTIDSISSTSKAYANRQVDRDFYRNGGAELRYLSHYNLAGMYNSLSAGVRYYYGKTSRMKNGKGDTGTEFSTVIVDNTYPQEMEFNTTNVAASLENIFRLTDKLIVIPAIRLESISTIADGRLNYLPDGSENRINNEKRSRTFALLGLAAEYHIAHTEFYANFTQSYRPMQFADLSVNPTTDVIDPNLTDAKSYSMDFGYRGKVKNFLTFDAGIFYLNYDNRIGTITQMRADSSLYNFRTNVGNSISKGFEGFAEFNPMQANMFTRKYGEISVFGSYAYTDATYDDFTVITKASDNTLTKSTLKDKRVENAPKHILRSGITYYIKGLSITGQVSYVSDAFSDANNTIIPTTSATTGPIPAYTVGDIALSYKMKNYNFAAGINNVADTKYFTRRAGGYPGPGLMPAEPRSFYVSFGLKL